MKIVKCPKCGSTIQLNESEPVVICEQCGAKFKNPIYVKPVVQEKPVDEIVVNEESIEPVQNEEAIEPVQNEEPIEPVQNDDIYEPIQNEETIEPVQNDDFYEPIQNNYVEEIVKDQKTVQDKKEKPKKEKSINDNDNKSINLKSKKTLFIVLASVVAVILVAGFIMSAIAVSEVSNGMKLQSIAKDLAGNFDDISFCEEYEYCEEYDGAVVGYLMASNDDNNDFVEVRICDSIKTAKNLYNTLQDELNELKNIYYYNYYSSSSSYYNYKVERKGKVVYYGNCVDYVI